jgi:hypoxanthine phosphoribosyltransferase
VIQETSEQKNTRPDGTSRLLLSRAEIDTKVREMGMEITRDYDGQTLVVIGVLKGAFIFLADLLRHLNLATVVDFIEISSYGAETTTSGRIQLIKDISLSIHGKRVLVVEDIVDTGLSIRFLREHLEKMQPRDVKFAALLVKKDRARVEFKIDYTGFAIANDFVVGYGLDYNQKFRNVPDVYLLNSNAENPQLN